MGKTRGVHETTPELRNRMVGMYEAGLGLRDIAAAVNCSQRTVKRWLNRFDKEGTVETRERCGRKRATTEEEDDAIIRLATQTPITAAKAVLPALGLTCSVDTIRERLHKAGIHNWSPSRKHMQRITLGDGDGSTIQQAVWRPTGTQLGKKKLATKESNGRSKKTGSCNARKKTRLLKVRARHTYTGDGAPVVNKESTIPPEFIYSEENVPRASEVNDDIQILNESLPNDQAQFVNSLNLVQTSTSQVYDHHPGLNVAQNWPLDLVQGSHHYPQGQPQSLSNEEPPGQQHLQELHTQREQEHEAQQRANRQDMNVQIQSHHHHHHHPHLHLHPQPHPHLPVNHLDQEQRENQSHPMELDQVQQQPEMDVRSKNHKTDDHAREVMRSDSCSNSCSSNDQLSESEEPCNESNKGTREKTGSQNEKKNKGGKAKGTLETSVEIRNRMIGMSEAGLSTLSIALAINRSERTVKRWLERWNKEGNVQTKERKGRRRITTKEQDDAIIAMATQHPLTAAKHVAPALGLNCSVDTIRERLHKAGIHSWKLGKKQGEGNAVHMVHLWQPSGNRPNKPKASSEKKTKLSGGKKRAGSSVPPTKRSQRKKLEIEKPPETVEKVVTPSASTVNEPMQFHENVPLANYVQGPDMMQSMHNLPASSLVSSPPGQQIPAPVSQPMQPMGPIMQQRSDCRMTSTIMPPSQANSGYPSCMVNNGNAHVTHMEQPDSLNYEPYIWSF